MIEDVIMTELRRIPDERGTVMHMLRVDDPHFKQFGEIYFSTAYPGVIKGWHEHTRQTQNYAVVQGMIKLVLYDNRPQSTTYQTLHEIFTGDQNYYLVTIPPGVVNGYKVIGDKAAVVANCATIPYDPTEMIRYDPLGKEIPYEWEIVLR